MGTMQWRGNTPATERAPRIYAERGGGRVGELRYGLPRDVLRDLRAEGWKHPFVVRELIDAPKPDTRPMPWQEAGS